MNETILLVEDEHSIRLLMLNALMNAGYRVLEAKHGQEAIEIFAEHGASIDLLVTDVRMPIIDGISLLEALRARRQTLKALFITGYPRNVPEGIQTRLLIKPFSREQLLDAVRAVLDRH